MMINPALKTLKTKPTINSLICESCGKNRINVKTAIVNGRYYKCICSWCIGDSDDDISSGVASYDRRRGYEDNAADTIQPYDADGKPNVEFLRLYPRTGLKVFGKETAERLKRKI